MSSTDAVLPGTGRPGVSDADVGPAVDRRGPVRRLLDSRSLPGAVLGGLCLAYALGAAIGWGSRQLAVFMGDFGLAAAALAAALSCLAYGCTVGGHARPAWLLFGLSSLMVAFGNGTWGWYELVERTPLPQDTLAEYAFLLFAPLAITGVLVLAQRPRSAAGWLCLMLDGWLVAGSLFTLSWSLALGRIAAGEDGSRCGWRSTWPTRCWTSCWSAWWSGCASAAGTATGPRCTPP
ncbi:hypothetical protein ACFQ0M_31005 [Kitasatospora aburaviensis]